MKQTSTPHSQKLPEERPQILKGKADVDCRALAKPRVQNQRREHKPGKKKSSLLSLLVLKVVIKGRELRIGGFSPSSGRWAVGGGQ